MDLRQLVAAGAQESGGRALEQLQIQLVLDMVRQVHILLIQEALDAVAHTVHLAETALHGGLEHASKAGVDDGGGAAGLSDNYVPFHSLSSPSFLYG